MVVEGGYCKVHQYMIPARVRGNSPHAHLYGSEWHRERRRYLLANPLCKCGARATVVDHIIPHNGDIVLFWDRTNWQSLCTRCHDSKTAREMNKRK